MDTPLGRLMTARNLTDEQAAEACGVSPGWIWQLRTCWKGKTPRAELADRLIAWLDGAAPGHGLTLVELLFPSRFPAAVPTPDPPPPADIDEEKVA